MPRQTLHIRDFGGVVANMDSKDIPVNKAAYSKNVDPIHPRGRLKGIKQGSSQTYHTAVERGVWIEKDASTKAFVYGTGSSTAYTESLASAATVPNSNTDVPTDMCVHNNAAIIGRGNNTPKWLGYAGLRFGSRGIVSADWTAPPTGDFVRVKGEYDNAYSSYKVKIQISVVATTPHKFQWAEDTGGGYGAYNGTDIAITTDWQALGSHGIYIKFEYDDIYGLAEIFEITCSSESEAVYSDLECSSRYHASTAGYFNLTASAWAGSGSSYVASDSIDYYLSFIYDGYQESLPLKVLTGGSPGSDGQYVDLTITANNARDDVDAFGRRITAVKIYGALNGGLPRFLTEVDTTDNDAWDIPANNDDLAYTFRDLGVTGYSYESLNGNISNLPSQLTNFTYCDTLNGFTFITGIYTDNIESAFNKVIRSNAGSPSVYDWTTNILDLNFSPKAIKSFNGRIYVFGENKYARINPDGLYVEDEFEGFGIDNNKAVIVTDYGMFWCNKNGAYMLNGSQPVKISIPIQGKIDSDYKQWDDIFTANTVISVAYSQEKESIIFCDTYGKSTEKPCWVFYLPNQDWYYWVLTVSASGSVNSSLFVDEDGYVYLVTGSGRYKLFGSASYETWEWRTRELDFDDPVQYKKVYKVKYNGTATVQYLKNATDGTFSNLVSAYELSSSDYKLFTLTVKISGSTSAYCDILEIIYRPLRGKR